MKNHVVIALALTCALGVNYSYAGPKMEAFKAKVSTTKAKLKAVGGAAKEALKTTARNVKTAALSAKKKIEFINLQNERDREKAAGDKKQILIQNDLEALKADPKSKDRVDNFLKLQELIEATKNQRVQGLEQMTAAYSALGTDASAFIAPEVFTVWGNLNHYKVLNKVMDQEIDILNSIKLIAQKEQEIKDIEQGMTNASDQIKATITSLTNENQMIIDKLTQEYNEQKAKINQEVDTEIAAQPEVTEEPVIEEPITEEVIETTETGTPENVTSEVSTDVKTEVVEPVVPAVEFVEQTNIPAA